MPKSTAEPLRGLNDVLNFVRLMEKDLLFLKSFRFSTPFKSSEISAVLERVTYLQARAETISELAKESVNNLQLDYDSLSRTGR